jgi:hypothetical protein
MTTTPSMNFAPDHGRKTDWLLDGGLRASPSPRRSSVGRGGDFFRRNAQIERCDQHPTVRWLDARPHPSPLPRGEGMSLGTTFHFDNHHLQSSVVIAPETANVSPSPAGEGRVESSPDEVSRFQPLNPGRRLQAAAGDRDLHALPPEGGVPNEVQGEGGLHHIGKQQFSFARSRLGQTQIYPKPATVHTPTAP